jgi:hypothetical protein
MASGVWLIDAYLRFLGAAPKEVICWSSSSDNIGECMSVEIQGLAGVVGRDNYLKGAYPPCDPKKQASKIKCVLLILSYTFQQCQAEVKRSHLETKPAPADVSASRGPLDCLCE